eukprot:8223962-Alexandrium_andersonii.AAC.1
MPGPFTGATVCAKARAQSSITVAGSSLAAGAEAPGFSPSKGSGSRNAGAAGRASTEGGLAGGLGAVKSSAASVSGES